MANQLPQGWKEEELRNIKKFEYINGVSYKPSDAFKVSSGNNTILLRSNNIEEGNLNLDKVIYVSNHKIQSKQYLKKDDILIATSSGSKNLVGKSALILDDTPKTFGAFCGVVRCNNFNAKYVFYYFQSNFYKKYVYNVCKGVNINNLKASDLMKLSIPYPTDEKEQKYIVDTLDTVAEMIRLRKETIQLTKDLIPSIFQEMFGNPITNPKGWPIQKIKENKNIVSTGRTPPTKYDNMFGGDIPFITPGDLDNYEIVAERTLTEEGSKYSRLVRKGTTLVGCIGNIGKTNITKQISAFNQQINAIEWNNDFFDDIYGLHLLKALKPIFSSFGGAIVPILNKSTFENIDIIRPPLYLQQEFAAKVEQINQYIAEQQTELEYFENLFQSLLQEAFTGVLTWNYPRKENND